MLSALFAGPEYLFVTLFIKSLTDDVPVHSFLFDDLGENVSFFNGPRYVSNCGCSQREDLVFAVFG